jgi:hypothetical protein
MVGANPGAIMHDLNIPNSDLPLSEPAVAIYKRIIDIPPLVPDAEYDIAVAWTSIDRQLDEFAEGYGIDLDPDFQRGHVWNDDQRTRYIEFILRGGTSSRTILFNQSGWGRHSEGRGEPVVLVDGKQRLETARMFLRGEVKAFGSTIDQFEDKLDRIKHRFQFNVNSLATRKEVLQWYVDLNSGGVVHTSEEIERVRALMAAES